MRDLRCVGPMVLLLLFGPRGSEVASVMAAQDKPQAPAGEPAARGRGRGRGIVGPGAVAVPGVPGRGGRNAGASLDPGGVTRQRLDLDTVIFTDAKGMTLYTFQKDTAGQSACTAACAANWPPLAAAADAEPSGDWTIVTRADATRQWAHMGRPLYTFVKDTAPSERRGEAAGGGAWHVASPIVPYVARGK